MPDQAKWKAVIYAVEADVPFKYWALAAYQDGVVMRYSRTGQYAKPFDALVNARDFAMTLNKNQLTPQQEGTTFTKGKLPKGRFLSDADLTAEYAQLARLQKGIAALKAIASDAPKKK